MTKTPYYDAYKLRKSLTRGSQFTDVRQIPIGSVWICDNEYSGKFMRSYTFIIDSVGYSNKFDSATIFYHYPREDFDPDPASLHQFIHDNPRRIS